MRIGIDARIASGRTGGIRTYTRALIRALEQLDSVHEIIAFRSRHEPALESAFKQPRLWTPYGHRFERIAVSVELARFRLDVLHSPDFIPPSYGARRHVITVHDLAFLRFPHVLTENSRRYYNSQIGGAVKKADHILAVSQSTKNDLMELLHVREEKITLQIEGVDENFRRLPPDALAEARQRLGLPDTFFLFVGTFEPRKNIPGLLEGYRLLRGQLDDAPPLVLVGRIGWLFDDALVREPREGVIWYEGMAVGDLPIAYNLATALVLPSFYEGFGLPALEAMACGTVPVVSNCSSLPELVGDTGALVEPSDPQSIAAALYQVATDDTWRKQQEQAALKRAERFTWDRAARTALAVYDSVLR